MKKFALLSLLWGVLVGSVSIGDPSDPSLGQAPVPHRFGPSVTGFTLDVLKNLFNQNAETQTQNMLFSPSSLYKTIMMLYLGSSGGSTQKIKEALHLENVQFNVTEDFRKWKNFKQQQLPEGERLFYQKSLRMKANIRKLFVDDLYGISTKSAAAVSDINNWATTIMGRREKLVTAAEARGQKLLPVSLAHSKPIWDFIQQEFVTNKLDFYIDHEQGDTFDAIEILSKMKYYKSVELGSTIFSIKYKQSQFTYLIFLPDQNHTMIDLVDSLTVERLADAIKNLKEERFVLRMPQFKLQRVIRLKDKCEVLGICEMLKRNTKDLKGFTNSAGIFVSEFLQKVEFEVHAESIQPKPTPQYGGVELFTVNRPFVYMVYDHLSKMPVLAGTMMNPKQL